LRGVNSLGSGTGYGSRVTPGDSRDRNDACWLIFPIKNTVPVRYPPVAIWTLIAINCAVFLFETNLGDTQLNESLSQFALVPARYLKRTDLVDYLSFVTPARGFSASIWQVADTP
jgi:membrane associated rhomboid family serine protease